MASSFTKALLLGLVALSLSQCKKEDDPAPSPAPIVDNDTHIIFWSSVFIPSNITVSCNGESKVISLYYTSGSPTCGVAGNATFDLQAGTYPYSATLNSTTWTGNITVGVNECKKVDLGTEPSSNATNSGLMAGSYTGNGEYLPGGVNLGTLGGCVSVPYSSYVQSGSATLVVTAVSDDVATFQYMSGSFPTITYPNESLTRSGNIISFYGGSFNIATGNFSFSGRTPNSFWSTTNACLIQLPYVYGWDLLITGNYTYKTIDHLYYAGIKD
ncbi:MAG: hypothetical protein IPN62_01365 [Flavobacteriales bacterium]|jgi:hypothetical protein|nr:hypothetical protein [Flavobacteriales bacterium]